MANWGTPDAMADLNADGVVDIFELALVAINLGPAKVVGSGFDVYFTDVGQGDATLIVGRSGEALLVDGGRSKSRIRDQLQRLGIEDLDVITMTHPDADHIAGLIEVLGLYDIERIYLNGGESGSKTFDDFMTAVNEEGAEVTTLSRGDSIPLGDLTLEVLHPGNLTGHSNRDSMVLLLSCGSVEVLLMADAEAESEEEMITTGVLVDVDVLKVGHHGSLTSTTQAFLDLVKAEVGVISAGLDNQFGHPHPEVDRLNATGVEVILSDTTEADDTVSMRSDCLKYEVAPVQP